MSSTLTSTIQTPLLMARRGRAALTARPVTAGAGGRRIDGPQVAALADLDRLEAAAKERACAIRSLKDSPSASADPALLQELLRAVTDQRKRVRTVRRIWDGLGLDERPGPDLQRATQRCREESELMAEVLSRSLALSLED